MTKNKIFFIILGTIILIAIFYFAIQLNSSTKTNTNKSATTKGAFTIWMMQDDATKMKQYIDEAFKTAVPAYKDQEIIVESFPESYSYYTSLAAAFLTGEGPDVFMLKNTDSSVYDKQIEPLSPESVSPNDFITRFKPVFGDDLIQSSEEDLNTQYLRGVPLGYEALGIYFNRRYFLRPSDLETWESLLGEVKNITEKYEDIIPIALGNGSSVTRSAEILSQLFTLEGATGVYDLTSGNISQAVSLYSAFGEEQGGNNYNSISLPSIGETDVDFFTEGKTAAMIGYPRDLLQIDSIGYQKSFLLAQGFPMYAGKDKKISISYNYFVLNKDSVKKDIAQAFLSYLASTAGQEKIIEYFPYYLPAESSVESEMLEKKILPQYNIVYSNFIDPAAVLQSFSLADTQYFTEYIRTLLDRSSQQTQNIEALKSFVICSTAKHQTLMNLSSSCNP